MLNYFYAILEWIFSWLVTVLLVVNAVLLVINIYFRWQRYRTTTPVSDASAPFDPSSTNVHNKLLVVIGSGGHTTEMLKLLSPQDDLYAKRTYVMANTDKMSQQKITDFEHVHQNDYSVRSVNRAREVGQSYATSIGTTIMAAWYSLELMWQENNGPAIGFVICVIARIFDLLGVHRCRIVFVESICRVQTLSLTGRLLYHMRIPHAFFVQWPELKQKYTRAEFIGRLV